MAADRWLLVTRYSLLDTRWPVKQRIKMEKNKIHFQLIWGILLLLAGVGVFFRIPQVMPQIKTIETFASIIGFVYFCFYLLGFLLVVGGVKKIYANLKKLKEL
jgi:cobalamin biosynthesis protein CobD/CbiB